MANVPLYLWPSPYEPLAAELLAESPWQAQTLAPGQAPPEPGLLVAPWMEGPLWAQAQEALAAIPGLFLLAAGCDALPPLPRALYWRFADSALAQQGLRPQASALVSALLQAASGDPAAWGKAGLGLSSLQGFLRQRLPLAQATGAWNNDQTLLQPGLLLQQFQLRALELMDQRPLQVKEVLTKITHWSRYRDDQLAFAVNRDLAGFLSPELGSLGASLLKQLAFLPQEVMADEAGLIFPQGQISYHYQPQDKRWGQLQRRLYLEPTWLFQGQALALLLELTRLHPAEMRLFSVQDLDLDSLVRNGRAKGFDLVSRLAEEVVLGRDGVKITLSPDQVAFSPLTGRGMELQQGLALAHLLT